MKQLFWLIPILLFLAQLLFTLNSQTQIRYEELAESVRNPFWLQNRLIYDGVSSNIGWYGTLLGIYNLVGFDLHTAKIFRLVLFFFSLLCLGLVLRRFLGNKKAVVPLLVIGLSPTLLYYNTLQASHGVDLAYFPIVLYLILQKSYIQPLGWVVAMIAWMSYPTFIFYLPALLWVNFREVGGVGKVREIGVNLIAFLIPLLVGFLFVKNRAQLLSDPESGSGIFRGAGSLSLESVSTNLAGLFTDLFSKGSSYHFDLANGDFSQIYPILTFGLVIALSFVLIKNKNYSKYVWLALGLFFTALLIPSLTSDPSEAPGIRRYTPVLAAFYTLFVLVWQATEDGVIRGIGGKWVTRGILGLLLVHHLIVYPINLSHLKDPAPAASPIWFNTQETPKESLQALVDTATKEELKLVCLNAQTKQPFYCRISEVYAAVEGSCVWNDLDCKQILGYDPNREGLIPLSTELWATYYFEH